VKLSVLDQAPIRAGGTPEQAPHALASDDDVDELVVVSICFDFAARMRSYELLAEAFELPGRS
jgi:hypothetical protein